jgi:dipeptidyl aminopeptidase/acylaminoacyl peptidase
MSGVKSKSPIIKQVSGVEGSINQFDIPAIDAGFDVSNNILAYAHIPCNSDQCGDVSKISLLNLKTANEITIPYFESVITVDPKFSSDGKFLAFRQAINSDNEVINKIAYAGKICILELKSNQVKCLADTFDNSPIILAWSMDNKTIYVYEVFHKTDGMQIYALDAASNQTPPKRIINENSWIDFTTLNVSPDNFLGFSSESQHRGQEAFQANLEKWQQSQQLTNLQLKVPETLGRMESISWRSNDGMLIEGILIKPANYDKNKKYPLLVG